MRIAIGSDHAAFEHKQVVVKQLRKDGHDVIDMGTDSLDSVDYPDFAKNVAKTVATGEAERGILLCGTGLGMSMSANKVHGIRAASCHDEYTTIMSRSHNDANVLCLGARVLDAETVTSLVHLWLKTPFEGGRHQRRLDKIMQIEKDEDCEG